jgi:hypothetical protein
MQNNFVITFYFEHENPEINTTMKVIRDKIFEEPKFEIIPTYQNRTRQTFKELFVGHIDHTERGG